MTSPTGDPDPDSIAERLKKRFGDEIEPTLPLDPEPAPDKDAPSSLFEKLRGAGTRGTRYRLLGEVARGGMGVILKIWDDELRRTLAMKVVLGRGDESKGDTPHVDPKTLGRFLEEAQVTGQLDHPGIVPVHELGLGADGRVYFTMRLVKGEDLRSVFEKVRSGVDDWNQVRALGVLLKVCEAMSYAHSKKVVHRDLKPANVMVGKFGEVYVMDWGLARVLGREDKHDLRIQPQATTQSVVKTERREKREETPDSPLVTMDGDIVGTPSFMPPEQAMGQLDKLGPHSDVYALGGMLYELLTGQMPYVPRDARMSSHTVLLAVIAGPPEPLENLAPRTPPELIAICEKAMSREISERYGSTKELASDLRDYLEGRVVRAYAHGPWARARKWVKRNRWLAASFASAIVLGAFLIVFITYSIAQAAHMRRLKSLSALALQREEFVELLGRLPDAEARLVPKSKYRAQQLPVLGSMVATAVAFVVDYRGPKKSFEVYCDNESDDGKVGSHVLVAKPFGRGLETRETQHATVTDFTEPLSLPRQGFVLILTNLGWESPVGSNTHLTLVIEDSSESGAWQRYDAAFETLTFREAARPDARWPVVSTSGGSYRLHWGIPVPLPATVADDSVPLILWSQVISNQHETIKSRILLRFVD